jgi:hypothetical protein
MIDVDAASVGRTVDCPACGWTLRVGPDGSTTAEVAERPTGCGSEPPDSVQIGQNPRAREAV